MARKAGASGAESRRKSEVVTIRLDPQLKYLAELAARRQRRPLSSFIEWAVERSLGLIEFEHRGYAPPDEPPLTLADLKSELWDVDEHDRFVKLALKLPELMDHQQQRLWKLVRECRWLWDDDYGDPQIRSERLREHWEMLKRVAEGEVDRSFLPDASSFRDEIPF